MLAGLLMGACDGSTAPTTATSSVVTSEDHGPSTSIPETTSTSVVTTTVEQASETTQGPSEVFEYAVIAEENSRRLALIEPEAECAEEICQLVPVATIGLEQRPHNLASAGPVVFATHPAAGSISRTDVTDGSVVTAAVGEEPHDVKYDSETGLLYVADEAGRALLRLDPASLEIVGTVEVPGRAHDLAISNGDVWVTLIGSDALARVRDDQVELFPTGSSPHDLIVDRTGMIWFSNWNSETLNVLDPRTGATVVAPAGVSEPHHFALDRDGSVWVSDNGGSSVVGFSSDAPVTVEVGPVPHHLLFVRGILVVAVSGGGEAVFIEGDEVVGLAELSTGLHGVTKVSLDRPLPAQD